MRKINVGFLFKFFCAFFIFVYSLAVGRFATEGDQVHYREIYAVIGLLPIADAFVFYLLNLDSKEVVHFLLSWIFATVGVEKDLFIAVSNAFLAYFSAAVFIKFKASKIIAFTIIASSFYFNVLYFSAERLKYGFIFFTWSILYLNNSKGLYSLLLMSVMSHVQMLISYMSIAFASIMSMLERALKRGFLSKSLLSFLIIGLIILIAVGPHVVNKLEAYKSDIQLFDLLKIIAIMCLTLYYAHKKRQAFYVFIPLVIVVAIIGSDRVMMLGYFVFLYYGIQINRGINLGILITTAYFSFKSLDYLYNLVNFGNGFYSG